MANSWLRDFFRFRFAQETPYERCLRLLDQYADDPLDGTLYGILDAMTNLEWPNHNTAVEQLTLPLCVANVDRLVLSIQQATTQIEDESPQTCLRDFDWMPHTQQTQRAKYFLVTQDGQPIPLQVVFERLYDALNELLYALNALDVADSPLLNYHYNYLRHLFRFTVQVLRCLTSLSHTQLTAVH